MKKPSKHTVEYWDYMECVKWINHKYDVDIDDFQGRFRNEGNKDTEYQSFWHYVVEFADVHNGTFIYMDEDWKEGAEPWQAQIADWFLEEFGEEVDGGRAAAFFVNW